MAPADFAVVNARIYTANPAEPWAEALASSRGRIDIVGRRRDVESRIGPRTDVVDADGRLILPGLIDSHVHLMWGFELGTWIDLTDRPSLVTVQRRIAGYAREHPEEELFIGHGFDYAALSPEGLPGKEDLDAAVQDRPVVISAWDGHTGLGNGRFVERALEAFRAAGKELGQPVRDPRTGELTGVFHEVFDLTPYLPEVQRRRSLDGLRRTVGMASRLGITTAFDVQVNLADLHAYATLWKAGELTVRVRVAIYHPVETTPAERASFGEIARPYRDDSLCVGAVKVYIDGVQETRTAALLEPYAGDPSWRGPTQYPEEAYHALVADLDRAGFQVCTHACGDRGVRIALDAYAAAARANGTSGRRHRIEHCENLDPADIPRFVRLGVVPCMMPRHASPELTARWREVIGPERTRIAFPWRGLLDTGATLAFASDWPVASMDPLVGIEEAVAREAPEGGPSPHRLTVAEAIDGYTRRGAYACHADDTRGTLEPGKYADLVVLSEDLFEIPPERVTRAKVLRTVVGGRTVHPKA